MYLLHFSCSWIIALGLFLVIRYRVLFFSLIFFLLGSAAAGGTETPAVSERIMATDDVPWDSIKQIGRDSLRQMQRTRYYLQAREDPRGQNLAVFVSNLPPNMSQRQYENILVDILGKGKRRRRNVQDIFFHH